MGPWIADANEVNADLIVHFEHNLLYSNRDIADFLRLENKVVTIVVGPKGYGKTLLLKAKRKSLQEIMAHIIPSNNALVDKPSNALPVIKTAGYGNLRMSGDYWKMIWLIAIMIAIFKEVGTLLPDMSRATNKLVADPQRSPCDLFSSLFSLSRGDFHQVQADSTTLAAILRDMKESVAVFIDNVDEYFEDYLRRSAENPEDNFSGRQDRSFWYRSQLGLAEAARTINQANNHRKIYVSVRKEILQKAMTRTAFGTQLLSKSLAIEYDHDDLKAIIEKYIRMEEDQNLAFPALLETKPLHAFFNNIGRIIHTQTGDEEKIIDFWLRHTLGRPRDVVAIGAKLSSLAPEKRTHGPVREAILKVGAELVSAYISEMAPHLDGFEPRLLFPHLKGNVLSAQDIRHLSDKYKWDYKLKLDKETGTNTEPPAGNIFVTLYNIGLLGCVTSDFQTDHKVQKFRPPGEAMLDENQVLPTAERYLIHPALDDLIAETNPDYFNLMDRSNIIGAGRRWEKPRHISYVLKGDVAGSSTFMHEPELQKRFEASLKRALSEHGTYLDYAQPDNGDSMKLASTNPVQLIDAAERINRTLMDEFETPIRFGGHAGSIQTSINSEANGGQDGIWGKAVIWASRLEPYVPPGMIYVTQHFVDEFRKTYKGDSVFEFINCKPQNMNDKQPPLECVNGRFDLSTHDNDVASFTEIYWIKRKARQDTD